MSQLSTMTLQLRQEEIPLLNSGDNNLPYTLLSDVVFIPPTQVGEQDAQRGWNILDYAEAWNQIESQTVADTEHEEIRLAYGAIQSGGRRDPDRIIRKD